MCQAIWHSAHEYISVLGRFTILTKPGEIFCAAKSEAPFHDNDILGFPVDLFDVVRGHAQYVTTTATATGQHLTSLTGLHPLAETMNTLTTTDFWLIRPLG